MRMAKINGLAVHYSDEGPADGPGIVFANSLGTDLRVWDAVTPLLPAAARVIRYDKRGHGLSAAPEGAYFMGDLVADAAGLIDHLGLRGVLFVGLSIGGVIAQGLAAERPDLVRGVVLSNTAPKIGTEEMWHARIAAVRAGGVAALSEAVLERWFSKRFRAERPDELAGWRNMLERCPVDGYAGCCAALAETDLRLSTAGLRQPALVIAGGEDGSTPPDLVREMAETIDDARFELIRGVGHIPCVEAPEAVARLIAGFAREIGLI
ncbi:MAG: 3-oxoadipate enol-lactonase [Rhodovulum sulfidophilum]|uniref:3-oxoadipate enol-lactonase n=1 Tax=Rhodovulum sulfidophilum TaxID=35806 RepID=A0A2W5N0B1_RHOSU|nr:MAG: 3-oxoadipate enol-lactonase [Rhodovulum sulfidophilum]